MFACDRYEAPCSPSSYCESDIPSSPSCSKERHSSSPQDREASTSPTTSAIKTVQNILARLQADAQTPLSQLVALQAPPPAPLLAPWLGLAPGLQSLASEAGNMQQLYLQHAAAVPAAPAPRPAADPDQSDARLPSSQQWTMIMCYS